MSMSASNRDFHVAIATAGGNPYFKQGYARMLDEGRRLLHMHFDYLSSSPEEALLTSEHADMIEAIRIKDTEKADQLAHAHTR
nr:FCD domain-containing protein [Thalassospira sp. UBA1131]